MRGKKVIYNNEVYTVIHDYRNGYIEIREGDPKLQFIKLVRKDEVELAHKPNSTNTSV